MYYIYVMMICMVSIQDADYNAVGAVTDKNKSAVILTSQ